RRILRHREVLKVRVMRSTDAVVLRDAGKNRLRGSRGVIAFIHVAVAHAEAPDSPALAGEIDRFGVVRIREVRVLGSRDVRDAGRMAVPGIGDGGPGGSAVL